MLLSAVEHPSLGLTWGAGGVQSHYYYRVLAECAVEMCSEYSKKRGAGGGGGGGADGGSFGSKAAVVYSKTSFFNCIVPARKW